jgi:uncharacterized protein YbjQ (UPF0145 family)
LGHPTEEAGEYQLNWHHWPHVVKLWRHSSMQIVTTPTVPGHRAVRSYGLVSGEAILGANIFRDLFAGVRDIIGGRSAAYEKELRRAKGIAIDEMSQQAVEFGANAIVGVDLDYETIDVGGGMLMVSASGTAVQIAPE